MDWKFWQKSDKRSAHPKAAVLSAPGYLPEPVAKHLVVTMKQEAEWVWNLKAVERSRPEQKNVFDVRVFDNAKVNMKKVNVRDYNSLDTHPELIAFEGWYNKKTREVQLTAGLGPIPKAA
ncbi:MAG: hypothetical protein P1P89_11250 [Desulfobacterales bacterium]|nr:hypothetical protein [Desulfobacterales bacterium]